MPDYLYLEPDQLRASAERHGIAAAKIREWGAIPRAWLDDYRRTRGVIAEPMRQALEDYYRRRYERAERQAENHERTRDDLLEAARAIEESDRNSGTAIDRAGDFESGPAGSGRPGTESSTIPPAVPAAVPPARRQDPITSVPVASTPSGPITPKTVSESASGVQPPPPGLPGNAPLPAGRALPLPSVGASESGRVTASAASQPPPGITAPSVPLMGLPETGPAATAEAENGASAAATSGAAGSASGAPGRPGPEPLARGPLMAAARMPTDRQTLPSLIVSEHRDDDLLLARTLLAATLAAVSGSAPDLEWAVAVMRSRNRPILLLTSSEGRGWLPPGLFLPTEVTTPWKWAAAFGSRARHAADLSEGVADPTRIFAELGRAFPGKHVGITALASSAPITGRVRESLDSDTATAERVPAAESAVDFGSPGPGLVDRLEVGGSRPLLDEAALVPESDIWSTCLALAREANTGVGTVFSGNDPEVAAQRAQRGLILESLRAGRSVPMSWIDEVHTTEAMMAAAQRSRQVDLSQVPVGARADSLGASESRESFFERRAAELLLLLTEREPDRQTLRDMFYAYGQIVEHPLFPTGAISTTAKSAVSVAVFPPGTTRIAEASGRARVLPSAALPGNAPAELEPTENHENRVLGRING